MYKTVQGNRAHILLYYIYTIACSPSETGWQNWDPPWPDVACWSSKQETELKCVYFTCSWWVCALCVSPLVKKSLFFVHFTFETRKIVLLYYTQVHCYTSPVSLCIWKPESSWLNGFLLRAPCFSGFHFSSLNHSDFLPANRWHSCPFCYLGRQVEQ
jgi:hypothetical protein